MADPVNTFEPAKLEQYKKFFQPPARPDLLGTPAGQRALKEEEAGLSSFLGTTDYSAQNQESEDFAKLQFALSLMGRGFASMGATPNPGEWAASTVGRNLIAPVAGDISTIAEPLMKQRQAQRAAQQQEERQLKLAALQNVQGRQEKAFADDATATQQARNFMQNVLKKSDVVSNDYIVDGKNVPLIQRKDYTGKVEGFYNLDGNRIENAKVKIYRKSDAASKPITSWAKDVQVKGKDGEFIDAPDALRIAGPTGENSRVVVGDRVLDFDKNSPTYNARLVEKGSDQSAFYSPTSRSVFLSKPAIELYDLPQNLLGQKATYREYLVRPERRGPNSQPLKELSVGGKTFVFNQHSGYDPKTGNITVERGPNTPPETYEATQLFREEDPKAFTGAGKITVPSESDVLAKINRISGLGGVRAGDKLDVERNEQGQTQVRFGQAVITLTDDQNALFQSQELSKTQKVYAGQELESRNTYVNTSDRSLTVGGQTIGPGQTGAFSITDINSPAFLNVSSSFREAGPVSTDAVTYMFKEPKTIAVGDQIVEYTPGDEVRYTPQEFANLPKALQKSLTDDTALQAATLKKNYFTAVWEDVIKREGLPYREIKPEDLQTLLGIFPAGSRAGQKLLRKEINEMISLGATANPETSVTAAAAAAYNSEETYAQSVKEQFSAAETRYNEYLEKGVIPQYQSWGSLSFEKKRAFADMPRVMQITNANRLWEKAQDRLAKDKASFKVADPKDVAAFSSAAELLILARHLRDGQELDNTGRFFAGRLGSLGANVFADTTVLTSGASQRLQQIINRMQASYATLSAVEGGGRDSVFRQQLQAALVPAFKDKTEAMNRKDLDSMINRLETNMRSVFNQEIQSTSTVPKIFEIMAKEAGMTGVSVDQKRYRWLDPNKKENPPVTRQRVMAAINMVPFSIGDVRDSKVGRLLPPASDMLDKRFVKIKNLGDGEVLIQRARNDGKPDPEFRPIVMFLDPESKEIKTRYQNGR